MVKVLRNPNSPNFIYIIFSNRARLEDIEIVKPYLDEELKNKTGIIYTVEFASGCVIESFEFVMESAKFITRYSKNFDKVSVHSLTVIHEAMYKVFCTLTDRFIKNKYSVEQELLKNRVAWENKYKLLVSDFNSVLTHE